MEITAADKSHFHIVLEFDKSLCRNGMFFRAPSRTILVRNQNICPIIRVALEWNCKQSLIRRNTFLERQVPTKTFVYFRYDFLRMRHRQ